MINGESASQHNLILREPAEETVDLYPGLCVCDDRVSWSITAGRSRLPLWAFVGTMVEDGWDQVTSEEDWPQLEEYGWTKKAMSDFLYCLTQPRGEFGRLLLTLAESERLTVDRAPWYERPDLRQKVREQLQLCLAVLDTVEE